LYRTLTLLARHKEHADGFDIDSASSPLPPAVLTVGKAPRIMAEGVCSDERFSLLDIVKKAGAALYLSRCLG